MKLLGELTIWQRVLLTFLVVMVILFALAVAGWISHEEAPAASPEQVRGFTSQYDAHLAELELQSLDDAYKKRFELLYFNWLNDPHEQPNRALKGMSNARAVYDLVKPELEKRRKP